MKSYKLIKKFPKSSAIGSIVKWDPVYVSYVDDNIGASYFRIDVEDYPEFWEEVKTPQYNVKIGDFCKFWDDSMDKKEIVFGILTSIKEESEYSFEVGNDGCYLNCKKATKKDFEKYFK